MIDLHSHILYGLDDGAATFDESLAMCRMAAADGIEIIAATPHSPASSAGHLYSIALLHERAAELRAALSAEGTALEIIVGTEIRYDADLAGQLRRGSLLTYAASQAILLEMPNNAPPPVIERAVFTAQAAGYRVVLTHPERCIAVQRDPNTLLPLVERGAYMQLTAAALTGGQGEQLRATTETLLTHGMAQLLASDAHGMPPRRAPILSAARARAAALIGAQAADALVSVTPAAILSGAPLHVPPPRPVERPRWRPWR
jgi:protein-tyrosine phosphatase